MLFRVKNTTFQKLLDVVCPCYCKGCGRLGEVLCECCKKDIIDEHINYCPKCKNVIRAGWCEKCRMPFSTFVAGWRDDKLGWLVEEYKYKANWALGESFAEIFDEFLPYFLEEVVIVPLPTIEKHIRERGFDHTLEIAKKLARKRGWKVERILVRNSETVQVGANEKERAKQAKKAYRINFKKRIQKEKLYLLLDDVWTTGASMNEAAKLLKKAGAEKIAVGVLAVNRIGKKPVLGNWIGREGTDDEIDYGVGEKADN